MSDKIKMTAVSYLNTKPLLYGLFKSPLADRIELQLDIPSACARKLRDGEVDLGLVPVAIIPELPSPRIISDYCIGTVGAVRTVSIFGDVPIQAMQRIYLDYHSRTSVELARLLAKEYWQIDAELIPAHEGFEQEIAGTTGGLVIGDRSIELEQHFAYHYDLGEAWLKYSGLPFVFAAWVSNEKLPPEFVTQFNAALEQGVAEIPQLSFLLPAQYGKLDLQAYFTKYISYELDRDKKLALQRFLRYLSTELQPSLEHSLA